MQFNSYNSIILGAILTFFFPALVMAKGLVYPDPSILPSEVVSIQLNGLKNNDINKKDFGIQQAWAFAHPRNRAFTGPLRRFSMMLKSPPYDTLLNHKSHSIKNLTSPEKGQDEDGADWQKFDVLMERPNGRILYFSWVVQKVTQGNFKDCWMTISVSAPLAAGQSG